MAINLYNSCFLCLDIGTAVVRGMAHRVRGARIVKSAVAMADCDNDDPARAVATVVDDLEHQLGARLNGAFVTGNMGDMVFDVAATRATWRTPHKISVGDMRAQIAQISLPDGFHPMHIIPLRYDAPAARNLPTPIGHTDMGLIGLFGVMAYRDDVISRFLGILRRAHLQVAGLFDPMYLLGATRGRNTVMYIDMGAQYTSASIWTQRGPVWMIKIPRGTHEITQSIADTFDISLTDAARIFAGIGAVMTEMDRFTPADPLFDFSRADACDVTCPLLNEIIDTLSAAAQPATEKYKPTQIFITGGGAVLGSMAEFITQKMGIAAQILGADAVLRALSDTIWAIQAPRIAAFNRRRDGHQRLWRRLTTPFRRRRVTPRPIPILPSTLAFNMRDDTTYTLFRAAGISMIHVDIMDGFFVGRVAGGIDELKYIRAHTTAHLSVHLMTESPLYWASDAIAAGADTIIVSAGTAGLRSAVAEIKRRGKRVGVAISPDSPLGILRDILREIDVVLVMSVRPGAGGQEFIPTAVRRIAALVQTRRKYGLHFEISVDGGINDKTAPLCWAAGADTLVAGSYLARASDFPLAVRHLMPRGE